MGYQFRRFTIGNVITNHDRNGSSGIGAWYHQLVRNGIWICPSSPIPAGYRSTRYDATGCGGLAAPYPETSSRIP